MGILVVLTVGLTGVTIFRVFPLTVTVFMEIPPILVVFEVITTCTILYKEIYKCFDKKSFHYAIYP